MKDGELATHLPPPPRPTLPFLLQALKCSSSNNLEESRGLDSKGNLQLYHLELDFLIT